jgi:hypothetical protein
LQDLVDARRWQPGASVAVGRRLNSAMGALSRAMTISSSARRER